MSFSPYNVKRFEILEKLYRNPINYYDYDYYNSEDQGAANFLIFSLLIPFIHREGLVGQQARDALLLIMSLSAENQRVAQHIAENTYFCPVRRCGCLSL